MNKKTKPKKKPTTLTNQKPNIITYLTLFFIMRAGVGLQKRMPVFVCRVGLLVASMAVTAEGIFPSKVLL
jgi:hypothetical protein